MPFTALAWPACYALFNSGSYAPGPAKELIRATKTTVYTGYRAHSPLVWDPNFKAWLYGFLQNNSLAQQWINGPNNAYFIDLNVDDADFLQGFGSDFKTDRKSTRLNSSHGYISYAVFCLKKKKNHPQDTVT